MSPEVARQALIATHGGLSLEWCATICHISPMALYRLICALGQHGLVTVLTRCHLPLPTYILADEKHSRCLTERVYLTSIVRGRVIWHLGYSESKSAAAFTESYGVFQRAALAHEPSYQVRGVLTDGFDSTVSSMRTLFPEGASGLLPAPRPQQTPEQTDCFVGAHPQGVPREVSRPAAPVSPAQEPARICLGPAAAPLANRIDKAVGEDHGERVRHWFEDKKAGWYAVLEDPQMPAMSTVLDQAHNAIDRKLFAMKGSTIPEGVRSVLTGLAHLYNLIPYQRRALNAGKCGVEIEGGTPPPHRWGTHLSSPRQVVYQQGGCALTRYSVGFLFSMCLCVSFVSTFHKNQHQTPKLKTPTSHTQASKNIKHI